MARGRMNCLKCVDWRHTRCYIRNLSYLLCIFEKSSVCYIRHLNGFEYPLFESELLVLPKCSAGTTPQSRQSVFVLIVRSNEIMHNFACSDKHPSTAATADIHIRIERCYQFCTNLNNLPIVNHMVRYLVRMVFCFDSGPFANTVLNLHLSNVFSAGSGSIGMHQVISANATTKLTT